MGLGRLLLPKTISVEAESPDDSATMFRLRIDDLIVGEGPVQGAELIAALRQRAREAGISTPGALTTPYLNTIPKHEEVPYPGDRKIEERLEALIRWNAMAMVHGQNKKDAGIGGHLSPIPR